MNFGEEFMKTFLLCKESKYILEIIEQIHKAPSKELSFKELENYIGITKQTIKNYVETLLHYCKGKKLKTFSVENNKLKMLPGSNFNILDLYAHFTQESVKYQIMSRILKDPQITFTKLYLDLAISRSSLSVHINQLNKSLEPYHCQINFLQKDPIQGEEQQIRFLYYNLFWGLYPDDIIDDFPGLDAITKLSLKLLPQMNYSTLSKIRLFFHIAQIRGRNGYFIDSSEDYLLPDSPYISYIDFFEKIDKMNFLHFCADIEAKHRECRYLYFMFCRTNLVTIEECKNNEFQFKGYNTPDIQYFISKFQEKSGITLNDSELKYLNYNLRLINQEATLFKGESKVFDLTNMIEKFKATKGYTATFVKEFLKDIRKENQTINTLIEDFPTLLHFYAMILTAIIEKKHHSIKLLVQSSISTLHREVLVHKIIKTSPVPIIVYTSEQLNGEKPDGIISNWLPEKKYQDVPFFSTSLFYSDWNHEELMLFINDIADKKNSL